MNQIGFGYGYDYYTPFDMDLDEQFYLERVKPLKRDNFENEINELVDNFENNNEINNEINKQQQNLPIEIKNSTICAPNKLYQYKQYMNQKHKEINYYVNHIYILYFVLLITFIYSFFQNMTIKNLTYILKKNFKSNN